MVIGALAVGLIGVAATAVVRETRSEAQRRCDASMPSFPARVLRVDVDWHVTNLGYDCVYGLYGGARLEMPACPAHHYRPTGGPRCVLRSR
jgi:hypothetical protein